MIIKDRCSEIVIDGSHADLNAYYDEKTNTISICAGGPDNDGGGYWSVRINNISPSAIASLAKSVFSYAMYAREKEKVAETCHMECLAGVGK